jgi:hypothetical protein
MHLILLHYSQFNDADSKWHYTALNVWKLVNNGLEKMWKKTAMA